MPNDATFELLAELQKRDKAAVSLMSIPEYNIDDMDRRECMVSLIYSGCYCLLSTKTIDSKRPGMIYIDGLATEAPLIAPSMPMFGQMIGIHIRKYLLDYDRTYEIRYAGAFDADGLEIPEFMFVLKTMARTEPGIKYPEHDEIVLQAAREGAVLLKNENNVLPLSKDSTANVFGAGAVVFRLGCLGAGKINPRYGIRVKEGIEKYSSLKINEELYTFYTDEKDLFPPEDIIRRAKAGSDTALIFITRGSSEAHDMPAGPGGYYLTDAERELIAGVRTAFPKTVAILNVAYPIETGWIEEYGIDSVLLMGLPGMAGGRALAEILDGTVSPSGKLPNTWARDYYDYPSAKNFLSRYEMTKRSIDPASKFVTTVYEEGLYVGYRYFDTFGKKAAFLFGHGLSYTSFDQQVKSAAIKGNGASLTIEVTNTGHCAGKEVVMLYARIQGDKLEQPDKRLVAFAKTKELKPGESELLALDVSEKRLKSYDEGRAAWIIEGGTIELLLGGSPDEAKVVYRWTVSETHIVTQVKNRVSSPLPIRELSKRDPQGTYPTGKDSHGWTDEELPYTVPRPPAAAEEALLVYTSDHQIHFAEVAADLNLAEQFVAQMSDYELARLSVGGKTGWGLEDNGFAGMIYNTNALAKYEIPNYFFADGNNGLNMFEPNIGFPVSTTICATFNEELSYLEGKAIAREAHGMNLHCLLAPALNLQRNPLCGRHTEYFSEDPYLAGRMAGQESRGIEDVGVSSCMKHFFANNAETLRNMNHSLMTERTARELYISAFETAFEVNMPDTVMTGYNAANGAYCSDDPELLRGILREELGFDGFVMTDWNGYGNQGMAGAIDAGISWLAPGSEDDSLVTPIVEALNAGTLSRARLQHNLVDLVRIIDKEGDNNG